MSAFSMSRESVRATLLLSNAKSSVDTAYLPKYNQLMLECNRRDPDVYPWWKTLSIHFKPIVKIFQLRHKLKTQLEYWKFLLILCDRIEGFKAEMLRYNPEFFSDLTVEFNRVSIEFNKEFNLKRSPPGNALASSVVSHKEFKELFEKAFPEDETDEESQLMIRLYMWWPIRGDADLMVIRPVEEKFERFQESNVIIVPTDPTEPITISIKQFKTSAYAERYMTRRVCPETLSESIRAFMGRHNVTYGSYLFGTGDDQVLRKKLEMGLTKMGIPNASINYMRRLAASNMRINVQVGLKSDTDEAKLCNMMMHSPDAHERYVVQVKPFASTQKSNRKRKIYDSN